MVRRSVVSVLAVVALALALSPAPSQAAAPGPAFDSGPEVSLGSTDAGMAIRSSGRVFMQVVWYAAPGTTGVVSKSVSGGSWEGIGRATASSAGYAFVRTAVPPGQDHRFRVVLRDGAGSTTRAFTGMFRAVVLQDSSSRLTYTAGWKRQTGSSFSGGSVRYATPPRDGNDNPRVTFRYRFSEVLWVSTLRESTGNCYTYGVDGDYFSECFTSADRGLRGTLYRHSTDGDSVADGQHTVEVMAQGGRTDIDAFVLLVPRS